MWSQTELGGKEGVTSMDVTRPLVKGQAPASPQPAYKGKWISGSLFNQAGVSSKDCGCLHEPEDVLSDENCFI